jgi:hypothetical protein
MAKSVEIPQDIIDNVIEAVGVDDAHFLKQCALVSSSFLLPSRKQLFSTISLENDEKCPGIYQFLVQNPVIQSFVRTIILTKDSSWTPWMYGSISIVAILRLPFCCLECFSIIGNFWNRYPWNWDGFSSELKDALSNIIHSSTLKTLSLSGIINVPVSTLFLHTTHFTTLELESVSPNDFRGANSSLLTSVALKGVAPMAFQSVIDRCVWHFGEEHVHGTRFLPSAYFSLIKDREGLNESIFLPFLSCLRFFFRHPHQPRLRYRQ